jgi:predicted NUDIX family NTP pyrophosphohydrolase
MIVHPSGKSNKNADWSLPKGEVDKGENTIQAAARELKEETGVEVETTRLESLGSSVYKNKRKEVHAFTTEFTDDKMPNPPSWEVDQIEFFNTEKAKELLHEGQKIFVDRLKKHLKGDT